MTPDPFPQLHVRAVNQRWIPGVFCLCVSALQFLFFLYKPAVFLEISTQTHRSLFPCVFMRSGSVYIYDGFCHLAFMSFVTFFEWVCWLWTNKLIIIWYICVQSVLRSKLSIPSMKLANSLADSREILQITGELMLITLDESNTAAPKAAAFVGKCCTVVC